MITLLKSKIHRATVNEKNIQYEGSITLDEKLMQLSDISEYEQVHVVNLNNGERFVTYVIKGTIAGHIAINGAAARLAEPGDKIIIISYVEIKQKKIREHVPKIVLVDDKNRVVKALPK